MELYKQKLFDAINKEDTRGFELITEEAFADGINPLVADMAIAAIDRNLGDIIFFMGRCTSKGFWKNGRIWAHVFASYDDDIVRMVIDNAERDPPTHIDNMPFAVFAQTFDLDDELKEILY